MLVMVSLVFFLALPFFDLWLFRRHLSAQKRRSHKAEYYGQLLCELWVPTITVLIWAGTQNVPLANIGLGWSEWTAEALPAWVSIGITVLAVLFIVYSIVDLIRLKYNEKYRTAVTSKLQSVKVPDYMGAMLPSSDRETVLYGAVAISAGITEEILYRGFLTHVLVTSFPSIGIWLSVMIAAFLFGLGHLYQGASGMLRTFVLGLIMSLIYLATGTLLLCIIIHILIDLAGTVLATPESIEPRLAQSSAPN
jgi:uncharacterized protein